MKTDKLKPHCFTRRAEGLPGIDRDKDDAIRTAFFNLAFALSERDPDPARVRTWFRDKLPEVVQRDRYGSYRKWICTALFVPAHGIALGKLYAEIEAGMARSYMEGKADGAHLLARLAKGEITADEFDERRVKRRPHRWM